MKKYQLLFKISAVFSYLFFVFGLSQLTLIVQNYWQFSSQIGNLFWIQNILSLLFIGVMIVVLVKTGHAYLFRIPRKKWLSYSVLTVLAAVVLICFNYLTAKHVQGTNEGWNLFIAYSETNFAEFGVYLTLIVLGPLMEELVCRGLLQHAFFKNSRWGLDLLFPSFLFALPHFSSLPSLADIFVYTAVGCLFAWLTRYTKSIYPSYSIHIVNNIIANLPFLLTFLHRVLG
ncbi:lysostaphin resistance A-like protein [Streptococcus pneumoniae]